MQMASTSYGGWRGPTDDLSGDNQNIPDWLIKITFLVKVETAVKSVNKSWFGTMDFSTSDNNFGPVVFSLTR